MIKAVWVQKKHINEEDVGIAHAMLPPLAEGEEKGYAPKSGLPGNGPGNIRTFMVHEGRMFVTNTVESEGYYYDKFKWEQHPTYPWLKVGELK